MTRDERIRQLQTEMVEAVARFTGAIVAGMPAETAPGVRAGLDAGAMQIETLVGYPNPVITVTLVDSAGSRAVIARLGDLVAPSDKAVLN
jgi:hypothetical protein